MTSDPRRRQRIRGPFEASWSGTSGHRAVRVADFSANGCFVEDIASPSVGERVMVTLRIPGGHPIEASGQVVYLYPAQGFGVVFDPDETVAAALHAAELRVAAGS
jgi:hypothetical protein